MLYTEIKKKTEVPSVHRHEEKTTVAINLLFHTDCSIVQICASVCLGQNLSIIMLDCSIKISMFT